MAKDGVNVLNACPQKVIIVSMRNKGALHEMGGVFTYQSEPYNAPEQLMKMVHDNIDTIISVEQQSSESFMRQLRNDINNLTQFRFNL